MSFRLRLPSLFSVSLILISSCAKAPKKEIWKEFSSERAFAHVQKLVDLGPRPAGSDALVRTRAYIEEQLESCGWKVTEQQFTDNTPRGPVVFVNLIARFGAGSKPAFLLCSHYDTKIFDTFRFVGANDGGSSNALLLEMARVLALEPRHAKKIELVFFDGEEAVENFSETDGIYGSRHFGQEIVRSSSAKQFRGGILFDMIGDRDLKVTIPPNSPPNIARDIFSHADAHDVRQQLTYANRRVTDDHTALSAVGMHVIDLIHCRFTYGHR